MSHPQRRASPQLLVMDEMRAHVVAHEERYGSELCSATRVLMDAIETLYVDLHFFADCQEYFDGRHNAIRGRRAAAVLERIAPLMAELGHEVSFRPGRYVRDVPSDNR